MLKYLLALFLLPSALCAQQTLLEMMEHGGLEREYLMYIPETYTGETTVPVVFNFHGYGSDANQQYAYSLMHTEAAENNFIVVYPKGSMDSGGSNFWNVGFNNLESVDDVDFTLSILDKVIETYNIDQTRVYSTGMSNGGFFSYKLACEQSDRFAAIASVTGTMVTPLFNDCNPERPVPVMQIHGTADATVEYDGETNFAAIEDVVALWVDKNNCETEAQFTAIPDIDMTDNCTAELYVYANGDSGTSVEFYKIIDGGHTWPGAFPIGVTNMDINATELIWDFFAKYDNTTAFSEISAGIDDAESSKVFPNPFATSFQIRMRNEVAVFRVRTIDGKEIDINPIIESDLTTIDASDWLEGMYLLSQLDAAGNVLHTDRLIK